MKFAFQSALKCSSRMGSISDIPRLPGLVLETPLLLLYTKGGSIPHLTHEVLQMLTTEPQGIQVTLSSTAHCHEAVNESKKGIADFVGLKECLTYCSMQDPALETPGGYNGKETVSIWSKRGKTQMDANKYMDIMEAFRPDIYHTLCDGDTNASSTKKRIHKSVERTHNFFEKCLARHLKSEVLKSSAVLAVIEGGYDRDARILSAKKTADCDVDGFVIDGLHNNGPDVWHLSVKEIQPIIEETLSELPAGKLRVVHGCWTPETVLSLVELGIDVFDASYPFLVTERGGAIVFGEPKHEISLADKRYFDALRPLSSNCSCLTCRKHTCAYIHHLINVKELLAPVLLMIHNLHQYLEFFKNIRIALKEDSLDLLRKSLTVIPKADE